MPSFANLPAPAVAAAASAFIARQRQTIEIEGLRSINHGALHDAEALARLAAASADGMVAVDRDDFGLIEADFRWPPITTG